LDKFFKFVNALEIEVLGARLDVLEFLLSPLIQIIGDVESHVQGADVAEGFDLLLLIFVRVEKLFPRFTAHNLRGQK
jgi:hypothetical protein